jgi:hypothetical protein
MIKKTRAIIVLIMTLSGANLMFGTPTESEMGGEYQVKAAFLYNFVKFVDWPAKSVADSNEPMTIGIIGDDPFGKAFEPLKNKLVKDKKIVLKRFKGLNELKQSGKQIEAIKICHLLFVCRSEKELFREIINLVKDRPVLTIADTEGFLESGGIINFLMEEKKIRFEINRTAAKQAKLRISSKLLRLAKNSDYR